MSYRRLRSTAGHAPKTGLSLLVRAAKHEGAIVRQRALNPLWVITIGMGAFFAAVAAIMAVH